MKIGIVMLSTPDIEFYAKFPRALWKAYCKRHGLLFKAYTDSLDKSRPPSWSKVLAVKNMMDEGWDWVWWMDCDSVPVNMGAKVSRMLESMPTSVEMVACTGGMHIEANTFMMRNSAWCRSFLEDVWKNSRDVNHYMWEQKSMIEVLNWRWRDSSKVRWLWPDAFHRWDAINVLHNMANSRDKVARDQVYRAYRPYGIDRTDMIPRHVGGREFFGILFSGRGLRSGVEVGVYEGSFSDAILRNWNGRLYCVDTWRHMDGLRDITNGSDQDMEAKFRAVKARLEPRGAVMMRMSSLDAAAEFSDGELDWVYIDADHRRKSVEADLEAWWPKVKSGGIVAGHDYKDDLKHPNGEFEVRSAVDGFFGKLDLMVWETGETDWRSWFLVRP